MSLPVIVDVAIGLIFIYLILSLLASEIQELLATIFQWRAKHLKESIEMLLCGGFQEDKHKPEQIKQEILKTRQLANNLYKHPLIKTLNYEKRGMLSNFFRSLIRWIDKFSRYMENKWEGAKEDIFDKQNSAPSYIPSDTFAATILETLMVDRIVRELNHEKIEMFKQDFINILEKGWEHILVEPNIGQETKSNLDKNRLIKIVALFAEESKLGKLPLNIALQKIFAQLDEYLELAQDTLPECENKRNFIQQLKILKNTIYVDKDQARWLGDYQISVAQVIKAYKEIKEVSPNANSLIHKKIKEVILDNQPNSEKLNKLIDRLPDNLLKSLGSIADKIQVKIDDTEEELKQFTKEVEQWFDRGMDRAAGVYKRNAKGVGFLIGLLIAIALNADIFHITSSLFQDKVLRETIVIRANQIETSGDLSGDFSTINQAIEEINLPLGWSESNRQKQYAQGKEWQIFDFKLGIVKPILGWIISGIAIAMGAPFWFDLLSKIVNVRNTGKKTSQ